MILDSCIYSVHGGFYFYCSQCALHYSTNCNYMCMDTDEGPKAYCIYKSLFSHHACRDNGNLDVTD